eukprot:CAMPEP_0197515860 /NCGR_PEP_ID=MMETSP1318-20131121/846_1 /TAXON_ID=552666 /ORGANISM="Partenskyella glossopodia, Strain RCC365" /LENGTH=784 /DNA_ID=CAMNT_0043064331 /DNA_START=21 /DNA_END=2375 /DNA_ORIENTATION=-
MNSQYAIVASHSMIYVWQYRTAISRLTSVHGYRSDVERETIWFIDEDPSPSTSKQYLRANPATAKYPTTNDPICCLAASNDTLMVGRQSGLVMRFSLPHIQRLDRYSVNCRPQKISLNCDSSKMSVIDINGIMTVFSINSIKEGIDKLSIERKDCWNLVWSNDNADLFACMEKSRMYVFRKDRPEEPLASSSYLCEFSDLCITAVQLDEIMKNPQTFIRDKPDECVVTFETKSLRDTKELLATTPMSEAYSFIEEHPHPRLWRILAEVALEKLNFSIADKAFVRYRDFQGIQFVKRLKMLASKQQQKAEVEAYFNRFAEAERLYMAMDKRDQAIAMRMKLGDWFRVVQLVNSGAVNDEMITKSWNNIGEYYAERQKWNKAKRYFSKSRNLEKVADCAYMVDDYDTLSMLLSNVPEGTPWLSDLGAKFQSVGLCEEAVECYTKLGDPKSAIDCCVLLNQWNLAVKLAEKHKFDQIEGLLTKYATHLLQKKKHFEAIELYQKAGRFTESARLLSMLAKESIKSKVHMLRAKKLFVLAAFDIEKYRKKQFDSTSFMKGIKGGANRAQATQKTLKNLMDADRQIGSDADLENGWHGALALHLYLLAQRQLYTGHYSNAMHTALQLGQFEDVLDPKDIYSLIAITAFSNRFYGQCSRAFIRLESLETLTEEEREKYRDLAMSIFIKNSPKDPKTRATKCGICSASCKPWDQQCPNCNADIPVCVVSGRAIFTQNYFTCNRCKSHIYEQLVRRFINCPLCHANLTDSIRAKNKGDNRSKKSLNKRKPVKA